jgi:MFS family permease
VTTLVVTSVMAFTAALDNTVVAVALRDLLADLGSSVLGLQGVVTAYTVTMAALLLPVGGVVDLLGARRVAALGVVVFGGASATCATAGSVATLVAARGVQGVGAALLLPSGLALLAAAYPDAQARRRVVGAWSAVTGAALVAGPVVGGELVARYGWEAVFWVNVPLCVAALLLLPLTPRGGRTTEGGWDGPGALLSCLALGCATYGVVLAGRDGLSSGVAITVAVSAGALLALVAVEREAPHPLLPPLLLRDRAFRGATLAAFAAALAVFLLMVFVSLFLQLVQDRDARSAGGVLIALPVALVVTAVLSYRWAAVVLPALLGLVAAGIGLLGLATALHVGVGPGPVRAWLALVGAGAGLTTAPVVARSLAAAGEARAGLASASVSVARELGGVVAVAGLGAVAVARLTARLTDTMVRAGVPAPDRPAMLDALLSADKPEVRRQLVESVGVDRALAAYDHFVNGATDSFVTSTKWVLALGGAALLLLALVSALLLSEQTSRGRAPRSG